MRLLILSAAAQATAASAPVAAAPPLLPPPPHSKVDATTLQGKLMFGYQGWFDTPASGSPTGGGWVHWSPGVNPNATNSTFDLWPALDELPPTSCHPTPELTSRKTGEAMSLFSSFPNSTAHVHFRWMREYGLNGVFVQRFVNGVKSGSSQQAKKDAILTHALRAAEANGRVVSLMYDTSGAKESEWASLILADWHHLINDLRVLDSPAWLYHDSKAVLSIWGIGFTGHPGTPATSLQLLKDLRAISPITFVGGVPTHWREGKGDSKVRPPGSLRSDFNFGTFLKRSLRSLVTPPSMLTWTFSPPGWSGVTPTTSPSIQTTTTSSSRICSVQRTLPSDGRQWSSLASRGQT